MQQQLVTQEFHFDTNRAPEKETELAAEHHEEFQLPTKAQTINDPNDDIKL